MSVGNSRVNLRSRNANVVTVNGYVTRTCKTGCGFGKLSLTCVSKLKLYLRLAVLVIYGGSRFDVGSTLKNNFAFRVIVTLAEGDYSRLTELVNFGGGIVILRVR